MPKHTTKSLLTYAAAAVLLFGAIIFITGANSGYEEPPFAVKAPVMISNNITDTLTSFEMVVTPVIPPAIDPLAMVKPKVEEPLYVDTLFGTVSRFPQRQEVQAQPSDLMITAEQNYMSSSQVASGTPPTEQISIAQAILYNESYNSTHWRQP